MNQPLGPKRNINPPPRRPVDSGATAAPQGRAHKPPSRPISTSQQALRQGQPPAPRKPLPVRPATGAQVPAAQQPRKKSGPIDPAAEPQKAPKPRSVEELIPALVRYAIKQPQGLGIAEFDEKLVPRMKELLPTALAGASDEVLAGHLLELAQALFIAIVCGQFKGRPVLCGVRAAELAADLVERMLARVGEQEDQRLTIIRCKNLLAGLTLQAVRLLETTNLEHESLKGFTDNYERAVIIAYGLKTQAEATGQAPWAGLKDNPLDKRIGATINTMSNVFGDYIANHSKDLSEEVNQSVLAEFDGFMERFAPYIEGGHAASVEKSKQLNKNVTGIYQRPEKVEPLEIRELRPRPAGVEIRLADGRVLFVSRDDARRIGAAADGEVEDTAKREREALEARQAESQSSEVMRSVEKGPSRQHVRDALDQRQKGSAPVKAPLPRPRPRLPPA